MPRGSPCRRYYQKACRRDSLELELAPRGVPRAARFGFGLEVVFEVASGFCPPCSGRAAPLFGLSDEFSHHSCRGYASIASVTRSSECSVPLPEIRAHNLTFDLHEFQNHKSIPETGHVNPQKFHLKIFGTHRNRYMTLVVPKCESKLVRTLKTVLDHSVSLT